MPNLIPKIKKTQYLCKMIYIYLESFSKTDVIRVVKSNFLYHGQLSMLCNIDSKRTFYASDVTTAVTVLPSPVADWRVLMGIENLSGLFSDP